MESALYGIYARVVFVSENERVSVANEWVFWYANNSCVNTVQSTFHEVTYMYDMLQPSKQLWSPIVVLWSWAFWWFSYVSWRNFALSSWNIEHGM